MERMRTSPKNSLTREEGRARSFDNGEDRQPEFGTPVGNQFEIFDVVRNGAGLSAFGQPRRITALFQRPVDPFDRNSGSSPAPTPDRRDNRPMLRSAYGQPSVYIPSRGKGRSSRPRRVPCRDAAGCGRREVELPGRRPVEGCSNGSLPAAQPHAGDGIGHEAVDILRAALRFVRGTAGHPGRGNAAGRCRHRAAWGV